MRIRTLALRILRQLFNDKRTLEKLLSTPIKRWEIVTGYICGFGIVTVLQAIIIAVYVIYVLNSMMVGSLWLVMLITLLSAMTALSLGMLLSTAAAAGGPGEHSSRE